MCKQHFLAHRDSNLLEAGDISCKHVLESLGVRFVVIPATQMQSHMHHTRPIPVRELANFKPTGHRRVICWPHMLIGPFLKANWIVAA